MDHLFDILNYFSSLLGTPGDDPLTEEWKSKQLRAWASLLFLGVGFGLSALLANALDTMECNSMLRFMAEQWRPTAANIVGGGLLLLLLFTRSVFRFAKKHGAA